MPSLRPSLPAPSKPSCSLLPFLTPAGARRRESYSPSTLQPFHQRQSEAVQAARFIQAKGGQQQQLPAALPASSHQHRASSPARAIASPGQNPPAWGWDRPPGTSIAQYLQNLRPLPTSPPQVHTHEQRSQPVVPGLGGSLLLPQPRRGSRGNAKGMLCPARKHGRSQAAERNQETARSTAPKICATNTCILLHMFKPN